MDDQPTMKGQLHIQLFDKDKNLKYETTVPNLVVATGRVYMATLLAMESTTAMSHMAIGIGDTAPNAADTTLASEIDRVAIISTSRLDNSVSYSATFGAGASGSVAEAGIFNNATTGTMLCRSVFGVITKGVDDVLTVNWTVTIV